MQIPYLARHFRVLAMDGLGNGRSDRCRDPRRYASRRVRPRLPGRDGRDRHRAGGDGEPLDAAPSTSWSWRGSPPSGWQAPPSSARCSPTPRRTGRSCCTRWRSASPSRSAPPIARLVGRTERRSTGARTTASSRSGSSRGASRSRTRPRRSRTAVGWALDTDPETLIATLARVEVHPRAGARCASWREASTARCWWSHGDRDKIAPPRDARALARLSGGQLEVVHGAGHFPHARKPVQVNLALRDFAEDAFGRPAHAARPNRLPARRPSPRPLHLLADRARPRPARRGDRARAAPPAPGPADRLARPGPGHPGAGGRGRAHPPRQRSPGQRVRATSSRSPPSTTCTASRRCAAWTRSSPPTSCSSTTSCARSATTCGSGTRRGSSTTTCTRTRARSGSPFAWLTDFVGFLPMDDGGRARELPDRRLQRRHGRPHRRAPRGPRPGAVRGQPRGHRPRAARAGAADDPRLDRAQLRLHRLRDRLRPRRPRRSHQAARRAGLRRRRARLHRHRRRLGRRRRPAATGDRRLPGRPRSASRSCA